MTNPTTQKLTLEQLFGVSSKLAYDVAVHPAPHRPKRDDHYVFRTDLLRDMVIFWNLGLRSCMLTGHKGSGKTSVVEQFHERMNRNLLVMTGHGKMTAEDLFGQYLPNEKGGLDWHPGPITKAAQNGWSVLINEFNALPADLQISLNDCAHNGEPVPVPGLGVQIEPVPGFRIFCTINPKGFNDYMYQGRKEMDASTKERFFWIQVGYASHADEKDILRKTFAKHVGKEEADSFDPLIDQMLEVAKAVRQKSQIASADSIPEIISTRVLVNWAIYWTQYKKSSGSAHMALQRALTFGCRPEVATAIHAIVQTHVSQPSPYTLVGGA